MDKGYIFIFRFVFEYFMPFEIFCIMKAHVRLLIDVYHVLSKRFALFLKLKADWALKIKDLACHCALTFLPFELTVASFKFHGVSYAFLKTLHHKMSCCKCRMCGPACGH